MKYFFSYSTTSHASRYPRLLLLLTLSGLAPAAFGQSFGPTRFYPNGPSGSIANLTLGDINGDGRPDIITISPQSSTVGVLMGLAGGAFAPAINYSAGSGSRPYGVALNDVNSDGHLDIITANYNTNTVGVLIGLAGGVFAPVTAYSTGQNSGPSDVTMGDINGDGQPDIITANLDSNAVGVLLGIAGGGFAPVTTYSTGPNSQPSAVALGDVSGDGRLDIVTANTNASTAGVFRGLAGGRFASMTPYSTGPNTLPTSVVLGDINGDSRLDIVTSNVSTALRGMDTAGALLGLAGGGFAPATTYSVGISLFPIDVALSDVDGDGLLDIVLAYYSADAVGVFLGQVSGGFTTMTSFIVGSGRPPIAVVVGDVNGDGRPDIVTAIPSPSVGIASVGVQLNTGTFTPIVTARPTAADLALYPNPAHEAFTVQLPAGVSPGSAELLNALGQVVRRPAVGAASFRVETSGLAPGVYTLRLQAGGAALARRVVVQ